MATKAIKSSFRRLAKYPIPLTKREFNAYNNGAKVFVNSLPKSGTFLLRRTLSLLPTFVPRWSYHGLVAGTPQLHQKIQTICRGQYASGHLYWSPKLIELLVTSNIRTLFIIRDLRDVAVSLADYLTNKDTHHRLHPYFKSLKSDDERLMAAIVGVEGKLLKDGRRAESLGEWAMAFAPWLDEPNSVDRKLLYVDERMRVSAAAFLQLIRDRSLSAIANNHSTIPTRLIVGVFQRSSLSG